VAGLGPQVDVGKTNSAIPLRKPLSWEKGFFQELYKYL
jgi:hypothetical protein